MIVLLSRNANPPSFFCELNQVVQLDSSDNFLNNIVKYLAAVLMGVGPFAGILFYFF